MFLSLPALSSLPQQYQASSLLQIAFLLQLQNSSNHPKCDSQPASSASSAFWEWPSPAPSSLRETAFAKLSRVTKHMTHLRYVNKPNSPVPHFLPSRSRADNWETTKNRSTAHFNRIWAPCSAQSRTARNGRLASLTASATPLRNAQMACARPPSHPVGPAVAMSMIITLFVPL